MRPHYTTTEHVCVKQIQNPCTLLDYKTRARCRTTKRVRVIEKQNVCGLCSSITCACYVEKKIQDYL